MRRSPITLRQITGALTRNPLGKRVMRRVLGTGFAAKSADIAAA